MVKWYGKYGRNVIRFGKCGRKISLIVKRYGKYGRKVSWIVNDMENTEENSEKIGKIWKNIVKWFGKYGRKVSLIVKKYGKYGRKI